MKLGDKGRIHLDRLKIMKKTIITLLVIGLMLATSAVVMARPAKNDYDGKTAGNSGFANIVGDNFQNNDITGWVRYSKEAKSLHTTWVIKGLEPLVWYQLKLHSKEGDPRIGNACDAPEQGTIWQCGFWGSESFLVMATIQADEDGHISYGLVESRLLSGPYQDAQFIVTRNSSPWSSAWTWENSTDSDSDPWGGDISTFTIK